MPREKGTLVFDIETVPDIARAKKLHGLTALSDAEAFEALKKYEHVNDAHATAARKEQDRRDTAALDELGLRRMSGR